MNLSDDVEEFVRASARHHVLYLKAALVIYVALTLTGHVSDAGHSDFTSTGEASSDARLRERDVRSIAIELKEAIIKRDIETLLKYIVVDPNNYKSYREARQALEDKETPIHCLLFDTNCRLEQLNRSSGGTNPYRVSVAEFFRKHPDAKVKIRFFGPSPADRSDFAQIFYVVPNSTYDHRFPQWVNEGAYLKDWGDMFVDACLKRTIDGWRYHSGAAGVFVCAGDYVLATEHLLRCLLRSTCPLGKRQATPIKERQ